jgi:hypothetical protein
MVASNDRKFRPADTYREDVDARSTATALQSNRETESVKVLAEFTDFAALPEIGPVPRERPQIYDNSLGTLAAYAETRVTDADAPFDAALTPKRTLDADAVREAARR